MTDSDTARRPLPVRMEPIATLPVFFKLSGRSVLIAGGSRPAAWKAELLAAAGAQVVVVAEAPCEQMIALAQSTPGDAITITPRAWAAHDLAGKALALGAMEEDEEAGRFKAAAQAAGVPVNVIDRPAFCDFQFGTIVSRSPLVIGISTDGAAPVFGQAIRARLEALLPQGLRDWALAAQAWRPSVTARDLDFRARRRFWEVFARRALGSPAAQPTQSDLDACLAAAINPRAPDQVASVRLVCAGSGDPQSVTLEAIGVLQDADIVFHGPDVPPLVIGYARREAEKVPLPADVSPDDVIGRMVDAHRDKRQLVWLELGSPAICLRWIARISAIQAAAIGFVCVEGLGCCASCTPACPAWTRVSTQGGAAV